MKPDIFMDDFSRDPEVDKYYAVLGRALAFATRFELNCRQLARFLALRINPEMLGEPLEVQAAFVQKAAKKSLGTHLNAFRPHFVDLPGIDIGKMLDAGREARNKVAHEIGGGVDEMFADATQRDAFLGYLQPLVQEIALADRIVCVALSGLSRDPIPTGAFLVKYQDRIVSWVLTP